jgi:hypothetical protein
MSLLPPKELFCLSADPRLPIFAACRYHNRTIGTVEESSELGSKKGKELVNIREIVVDKHNASTRELAACREILASGFLPRV